MSIWTISVISILKLEPLFFIPQLYYNLNLVRKLKIRTHVAKLYLMVILMYSIKRENIFDGHSYGHLSFSHQCQMTIFPSLSNPSITSNKDIMKHHLPLGHPNFLYVKRLFSSLFINKYVSSIQLDMCEFTNHTGSSYTPKRYTLGYFS